MNSSNLVVRSLHDVGLATWFGGSLMGAIGVNGAANHVTDRTERAPVAAAGWAQWAPVNAVSIAAHLVGGIGLIVGNRKRLGHQSEARGNTLVKAALTGVAVASTAYSGVLGAKVAAQSPFPAEGGVIPASDTPPDAAEALQQLRIAQWVTPVVTAVLLVLGAQQGEQQRPGRILQR